mmetsp:Transcript_77939/g.130887  ORF Transcript_77939/g.130887 Transcript_77939/m.130887 type:complete len:128 (+) Transcript_77939:1068-1451(+)
MHVDLRAMCTENSCKKRFRTATPPHQGLRLNTRKTRKCAGGGWGEDFSEAALLRILEVSKCPVHVQSSCVFVEAMEPASGWAKECAGGSNRSGTSHKRPKKTSLVLDNDIRTPSGSDSFKPTHQSNQ